MTGIHQFLPRLEPSAVGAHARAARSILQDMGHESEIYADGADPMWSNEIRPCRDYGRRSRPGDILLYQAAVGAAMVDGLMERPEPLVVNYHNVTPARFFRRWEPDVVHAVNLGVVQVRMLASRATAGIAVSSYNEAELRQAGYRHTMVAPVLFDVDGLRREIDEAALARLQAAKTGADIVFVGRVAPHKAQHDLIKALAAYRRAYDSGSQLHIIGAHSSLRYWSVLERYIEALGLAGAVHLTGSVTAGELAAHYRNADVFLCLSEHEGFCVPLVEAMANDTPIVAFGAAAVPETLAGAGVLLDSKDTATVAAALHRVLGDGVLREQLVDAGRARLADFSPEILRGRFEDAIRQVEVLLGGGGR
jgi:glycosyltransferase involved in cell wall biosynthesis